MVDAAAGETLVARINALAAEEGHPAQSVDAASGIASAVLCTASLGALLSDFRVKVWITAHPLTIGFKVCVTPRCCGHEQYSMLCRDCWDVCCPQEESGHEWT